MENFTFIIDFYAENREDAMQQASRALDAFDDGFSEARLKSAEIETDLRVMTVDEDWQVAPDRIRLVRAPRFPLFDSGDPLLGQDIQKKFGS